MNHTDERFASRDSRSDNRRRPFASKPNNDLDFLDQRMERMLEKWLQGKIEQDSSNNNKGQWARRW